MVCCLCAYGESKSKSKSKSKSCYVSYPILIQWMIASTWIVMGLSRSSGKMRYLEFGQQQGMHGPASRSLVTYIYSSPPLINAYMLIARMPMQAAGQLRLDDVIGLLACLYVSLLTVLRTSSDRIQLTALSDFP